MLWRRANRLAGRKDILQNAVAHLEFAWRNHRALLVASHHVMQAALTVGQHDESAIGTCRTNRVIDHESQNVR